MCQVDLDNFVIFGVGVGPSSRHSFSRPWAAMNSRVTSSLGKIEVVAPSSAPMLVMVARSVADRLATPSPPYSMILPTPPLTLSLRRTSRITSLAETQGCSLPVSLTRHDLRHRQVERLAGHRRGHVQPARADREHAEAAAGGGVAVGAQQRLAGDVEPLELDLVADAVAGPGEVDAVLRRDALQVRVVVGVLEAGLERVVVDVADGALRPDLRHAHRLELQVGHRAGGVLREVWSIRIAISSPGVICPRRGGL